MYYFEVLLYPNAWYKVYSAGYILYIRKVFSPWRMTPTARPEP